MPHNVSDLLQSNEDNNHIYLVKDGVEVHAYGDTLAMQKHGVTQYDVAVPAEEWDGYARIDESGAISLFPSLSEAKDEKLAELASARWAEETGGIDVNGTLVATDRESQSLLTAAALVAMQDPGYVCNWKARSGWVTLDAGTIIAIANAVRSHVQACFDKEKQLSQVVAAAASLEDVRAISW